MPLKRYYAWMVTFIMFFIWIHPGTPLDQHPACSHVEVAMHSSSMPMPLELKLDTLSTFPFPTTVKQTLEKMATPETTQPAIIQRVSERSFVIRTLEKSFQTPMKLLHIRFDGQNHFHCQCSQFKKTVNLSSATTAPNLSKRCIHLYICIWAFLSCENLQQEFSMHLHKIQQGMPKHIISYTAACVLHTISCLVI